MTTPHVEDLLWDWLTGALSEEESERVEIHLDECESCREALELETSLLAAGAPAVKPPPRLFAEATTLARFAAYTDEVARLMDVGSEKAREWLSKIDDEGVWEPTALGSLTLYHIEGGPAVERAITGFNKLEPGTGFPEHTHLGKEYNFVIQGWLVDEHGVEHGPGSLVERDQDYTHEISARADGPPLIYLAITYEGVEIFGMRFGPDSPEL